MRKVILKPCPFCGVKPKLKIQHTVTGTSNFAKIIVACDSARYCLWPSASIQVAVSVSDKCFNNLIDSVVDRWNKRPSPWISADKKKPTERRVTVAILKNLMAAIATYTEKTGWRGGPLGLPLDVTHWMYLPEMPKK